MPTQNPYTFLRTALGDGLNYIISHHPTSVDLMAAHATIYVISLFYPSPSDQVVYELFSVSKTAINSYQNNLVLNGNALYDMNQGPFIIKLIASNSRNTQPDTLAAWINDVQDNVGISGLTINEQIPLFLATLFGFNATLYWQKVLAAAHSPWAPHLSTIKVQNYVNSFGWDVGAMNGALAGYGATPMGLVEPTTNKVTTQMVSALLGALTVTAGRVMFKWIPRINTKLSVNQEFFINAI